MQIAAEGKHLHNSALLLGKIEGLRRGVLFAERFTRANPGIRELAAASAAMGKETEHAFIAEQFQPEACQKRVSLGSSRKLPQVHQQQSIEVGSAPSGL